jgi:hypothetical protein
MEVRFYIDPSTGLPHIYAHQVSEQEVEEVLNSPGEEETMKQSKYPAGWDEERVRSVLEHYENQAGEEAVAEDEAAFENEHGTFIEIPSELVPTVRELIAKHQQ